MLELTVKVININLSSGHRFLQECRSMYEYSWFIQRIKDYLLADIGEIPEDILARIQAEESPDTLRRWLKVAARAESMEDFQEKML